MFTNKNRFSNERPRVIYNKGGLEYSKKASLLKNIQGNTEQDNDYVALYEKIPMDENKKKIFEEYKVQLQDFRTEKEKILTLINDNNFDQAAIQYKEMSNKWSPMFSSIDNLIKANVNKAKLVNEENVIVYNTANTKIIIYIIVGIILAVALASILTREITRPLLKIRSLAERLSKYDFSTGIAITGTDEFSQTGIDLNKAQKNVSSLIKTIMDNSQDMSAASEELSAMTEELTANFENIDAATKEITGGVQETSASAEEISASVQEVDASINQLSEKSMEGSNSSASSKERAIDVQDKGKKSVQSVQNMAGISQKASENADTIQRSMDESTQGIEQVARTSQEQAELSQKLNEIVQKFKI
ncbi:methyl-accepting chemotaxis protein [Clostridium arbusti]|uniref:methyl-accepting chemotaxis protein n=1 Tax=Clostridium arbusti TaxID=1137848 RepID=UPI000288B249|nr:methyl-accepting chemotaxis protein [Clostridium arbusti]